MSVRRKTGSIIRVNDGPGKVFVFIFESYDAANLPTEDVGSGSIALAVDTGDRYIYHEDAGWMQWTA